METESHSDDQAIWQARGLSPQEYDELLAELESLSDEEPQKISKTYVAGLPVREDFWGQKAQAILFARRFDREIRGNA